MGRLPSLQTKGYNDNQKQEGLMRMFPVIKKVLCYQGRIQALFEIGNRFWVHENRRPNFARSTKDIILILFDSS